jgi:hypothetical protein
MQNELINLIRALKILGKDELCQKLKLAIAKKEKINTDKIDLSYSYECRELRQSNKEKLKEFRKEFKKVFDDAFVNGLENPEEIALMHVIDKFDL